jgi:hypothetical protein
MANPKHWILSLTFAGLCLGASPVSAAELSAQFHDHTYVWPEIGTSAYSASCELTQYWEDGSAVAYCTEDGETYVYDPDGQPVPNVPDNPVREPGWYVAPELLQEGPGAR